MHGPCQPNKAASTGSHHPHIQVVRYKNHCGTSAPALGFISAKRRTLDGVSKSRHLINGRDDFHVVPFLFPPSRTTLKQNPPEQNYWDDVEVVPTRFLDLLYLRPHGSEKSVGPVPD